MLRNGLTIAIVFILVVSFIILWDSPPALLQTEQPDAKQRFPIAIITQSTTRKFDEDGNLSYTFYSDQADHFQINPNRPGPQDYLDLIKPELTLFSQTAAPWHVQSDKGRALQKDQTIELKGHVVAQQNDANNNPSELTTSYLRLKPETQYAETDKPVMMRSPGNTTKAVGLQAYLRDNRVLLLSQVRGTHEPR